MDTDNFDIISWLNNHTQRDRHRYTHRHIDAHTERHRHRHIEPKNHSVTVCFTLSLCKPPFLEGRYAAVFGNISVHFEVT